MPVYDLDLTCVLRLMIYCYSDLTSGDWISLWGTLNLPWLLCRYLWLWGSARQGIIDRDWLSVENLRSRLSSRGPYTQNCKLECFCIRYTSTYVGRELKPRNLQLTVQCLGISLPDHRYRESGSTRLDLGIMWLLRSKDFPSQHNCKISNGAGLYSIECCNIQLCSVSMTDASMLNRQ